MITVHVRVGNYESHRRLAIGGMSEVFLATDVRDGRTVALKISRSEPELRETERRGALLQRALSEIDGRVPRVFDIGEQDGALFVAMEYVEGEDLADLVARGPLAPAEAVRIAIELCELLAKAHVMTPEIDGRVVQGMVHGDLKPRNVRIERGGAVKVLDFGIAKALSLSRRLTRNEFLSLPYCSPERIESANVDAPTDLWSLGIVLYEMLTGRTPHGGASTQQLEGAIRSRTPLPALPPGLPAGLGAILAKALAPSLPRRYPTAEALRADLVAVSRGEAPGAAAETNGSAGYEATRRSTSLPSGDTTRRGGVREDTVGKRHAETPDPAPSSLSPDPVTARSGSAVPGSATAPAPPAPPAGPAGLGLPSLRMFRPRRLGARLAGVAIVLFAMLMVNELSALSEGSRLRASLPRLSRADGDDVWNRYQQLRRRSRLGVAAFGLDRPVKDWFVGEADALISDYRSDYPTIRENGWREAGALLERASSIGSGDRRVEARRLYVDGQLARIRGQGRRGRPAQAQYAQAIRSFEESARRWDSWPDPYLGMARTYAYGLEDWERAENALADAQQRGYPLRSREIAMVADGQRLRAQSLWTQLDTVKDLPQERRWLDQIQESCERALELYDQIPDFGEVARHVREVQLLLEQVRERRSPWPW